MASFVTTTLVIAKKIQHNYAQTYVKIILAWGLFLI